MMKKTLIAQNWQMRWCDSDQWFPAQVPGSVYADLLANGQMADPFYRDNEEAALKWMEHDFVYQTMFDVSEEYFACQEVLLHFEGLDTLATIWFNDTLLGKADNMHRVWEFPVKTLLQRTNNVLRIQFASPTKYIAEEYEKDPLDGSEEAMRGFSKLRKAHCMFGWDWGPRLPDAGIWRPVSLLGITEGRLADVSVTQQHEEGRVTLQIGVTAEKADSSEVIWKEGRAVQPLKGRRRDCATAAEEGDSFYYTLSITDPDGVETNYENNTGVLQITNPRLWWPNGYGEQPLYTVEVILYHGTEQLDTWKKRIGLRTLTMHIEEDAYGEQFAHEINGVCIFAMGADYIPEDNIFSRVTPEKTYHLLKQGQMSHYNVVRVWGGGYYPDDWFYDACDELGLIVWQDFMFACAHYRLTEEMEENIRQELVDNVKRIRHHACLGLWCGNNEMEMFTAGNLWTDHPRDKAEYIKLYEYVIPNVLKTYDPQTFYWPASPSSGGSFDDANDENRGDVHYWDVWHGGKPFTDYRNHYFRYLSEFGFQSFPFLRTVETFTEPEDRNIFSYVMEKHQRNGTANGKMMNYLQQTFLYPARFDTLLYASQILQAEAVRYGIEHCRRYRGRCMGTIVWQLNDCWPVASWASIDYSGRWKALQYAEKRSFAPVMVSCKEEGMQTQYSNVNEEPFAIQKKIQLCVCSEALEEVSVTVAWELRDARGAILSAYEEQLIAAPLSAQWLPEMEFPQADLFGNYVSYRLSIKGEVVSGGTANFCPHKYFRYEDPKLTVDVEGDAITVKAESFAKFVEIQNEDETLVLEDNYFDLNGEERTVRILSGTPKGLRVRSVYEIR